MTVVRNILAVVFGLVVGSMVNLSLVMLGPALIPPPADVDVTDAESLRASIHRFEAQHFVFPFLAHALGTLTGALTAFLVAATYRSVLAFFIGAASLAGGIAAATMIPAPTWFVALDLVGAYIPMAWLGTILGGRFVGEHGRPRFGEST